jgi:hypothetical protein
MVGIRDVVGDMLDEFTTFMILARDRCLVERIYRSEQATSTFDDDDSLILRT